MANVLPISVFIIAKNEADRITHTMNSVAGWVDEIIVIDSGSTDATVQVSETLGARVIYHEWQGYGPQKRFGEQQCRQNWLLNLDADEAVSEELREEIHRLFSGSGPDKAGYRIPIRLVFPGDAKPRPFAPTNNPVRLYNRQRASFRDAVVHDSVVIEDGSAPGTLRGCFYHRCFRSIEHAMTKINYYSSMQAKVMVEQGRIPTTGRLIAEPLLAWLKALFIRRYIFFGLNGLVEARIYAFGRFVRLAKARELARLKIQE